MHTHAKAPVGSDFLDAAAKYSAKEPEVYIWLKSLFNFLWLASFQGWKYLVYMLKPKETSAKPMPKEAWRLKNPNFIYGLEVPCVHAEA